MTQIFGYKLTAEDGSESKWMFINRKDDPLALSIRVKNGARIVFTGFGDELARWAAPREFKVDTCVFDFDPIAMSFTREA